MNTASRAQPRLARITIYPIKSLDGVAVERATALAGGALEHDRRFALRDQTGEYVNGKRFEVVHRLRSTLDSVGRTVSLAAERTGHQAASRRFDLDADRKAIEAWLRDYFGLKEPLELIENAATGFPDDTDSPGPTIVSTATLETVADWFPGLSLDEVRRRFRANLEIGGVEAFWEDRLYGEADQVVRFQIGALTLEGVNPCRRCAVPSRDSLTGAATPEFAKRFAQRREQTLPAWAARSRFDHFYRLAVNTRPASCECVQIQLGDRVRILGTLPKSP